MAAPSLTALILAGGRATRMGPACADLPKCMLPVGGIPFLHWLLSWLARRSVPTLLAVRHHADVVEAELSRPPWSGLPVAAVRDRGGEGTGAAVLGAAEQADSERLLVMNGDTLFTCGLDRLLRVHQAHGAGATQVLTRRSQQNEGAILVAGDTRRVLATAEGGRARSFADPPGTSRWSSTGWYVFDRRLLLDPALRHGASLETDLVPALIRRGTLYAHTTSRSMHDFGTPDRYARVAHGHALPRRLYGAPLEPRDGP